MKLKLMIYLLSLLPLALNSPSVWPGNASNLLRLGEDSGESDTCKETTTPPTEKCAKAPSADFDAKGRLWVSWVFQDRIYVQSSTDGGHHMSIPLRVNRAPEKILTNGENRPKIKIGPRGQIYVTWSKSLEKGFSNDVRFSRSLDGGKTFSDPITLNDDHEVIGQSFESLAIGRDGRILVAWLDARDAEAAKSQRSGYNGSALYYTWSDNEGESFGPNIKAADHACECCRLQTAIDVDGIPAMAWRNIYPENIRDHALIKLNDWNVPGKPVRVSHDHWYIEGCPHHGPGFSIAGDGRYHITWYSNAPDATGIFYAYSDDMGAHFSKPLSVGNPKISPSHPHVLSLGKSVFLVWLEFDGAKNRLVTMRSTDAGMSWSEPAVVEATEAGADSPFLTHQGDKVYVSWATTTDGLKVIPLAVGGSDINMNSKSVSKTPRTGHH